MFKKFIGGTVLGLAGVAGLVASYVTSYEHTVFRLDKWKPLAMTFFGLIAVTGFIQSLSQLFFGRKALTEEHAEIIKEDLKASITSLEATVAQQAQDYQDVGFIDTLSAATANILFAEWTKRGSTSSLRADTIIAIARRLPNQTGDIDSLIISLINSLDSAEALFSEASNKSGESIVDSALQTAAEYMGKGELDIADERIQSTLNAMLANDSKEMAHRELARKRVLEAGIHCAYVRTDFHTVADREIQLLKLSTSNAQLFMGVVSRFNWYIRKSKNHASIMDLEVASSLAQRAADFASSNDEKAATLYSYGIAQNLLGQRGMPLTIDNALKALKEAVALRTSENRFIDLNEVLVEYGIAQMRKGTADEPTRLLGAKKVFRECQKNISSNGQDLLYSKVSNALARTLTAIAKSKGDIQPLNLAIEECKSALKIRTQDKHPELWAETMITYGNSLSALDEFGKTGAIEDAILAYEQAITVFTELKWPSEWARIQNNLGYSFFKKGCAGEPELLDRALAAIEDALRIRRRDIAPAQWARSQENLALILKAQGEKKHIKDLVIKAIDAATGARSEFEKLANDESINRTTIMIAQLNESMKNL